MALAAFSTETVYMHASMEGCIQVAAKPLIKIYRIPRDFADSLVNEPDLKQAGIYLLVNRDAHTLYVGQADARDNGNGVLKRMLEQHTKKKEIDQWDVGYAMISGTPQFFGATELNYLERYFYDKAIDVGPCVRHRRNVIGCGRISSQAQFIYRDFVIRAGTQRPDFCNL